MLKEIMLASALTLSAPPNPTMYDVTENFAKMYLDFYEYDWEHYNSHIINLNNGTSEISLLSLNEDGIYNKRNTTSWSDVGISNMHDALTWTFSRFYDGRLDEIPSDFSLEIEFESIVFDFDSAEEEIVIPCFIALPGEDDTQLENVSGVNELRINYSSNSSYLYFSDWQNPGAWINASNSYLVLMTDYIEGSNGSEVNFSAVSMFTCFSNMYLGFNDDYYHVDYQAFIYNYYNDWFNYGLELETRNEELTNSLIDLQELYNKIRDENERLNSKHALSNVFDIIRSSFNGIVEFLEIELMPNLTIGTIFFIPVVIGVIFFILKALVL